jgi:hypothetical protein
MAPELARPRASRKRRPHPLPERFTSEEELRPMRRRAQVFTIPKSPPSAPPVPGDELVIEAPNVDALRVALRERLEQDGHRVRAVSFGRDVLFAYVEERP